MERRLECICDHRDDSQSIVQTQSLLHIIIKSASSHNVLIFWNSNRWSPLRHAYVSRENEMTPFLRQPFIVLFDFELCVPPPRFIFVRYGSCPPQTYMYSFSARFLCGFVHTLCAHAHTHCALTQHHFSIWHAFYWVSCRVWKNEPPFIELYYHSPNADV